MPFIGNQPATSFEAVKKDRFTGLTGTSVTLSHAVSTVEDIVLWINAVKQDYTSYSVSGTALTVGGSLVSSDIVEVAYLGRTFQTVNPPAGSVGLSQLSATGTKSSSTFLRGDNTFDTPPLGGITEADQWRLTADYTWSSPGDLTANLERVDSTGWGKIGTGMSESSGIFTFPSTGIWFIKFNTTAYLNGDRRSHYIHIKNTTNNSSYNNLATAISHIKQSESNTTYIETSTETLLDVTDLTNDKVKFSTFTSATFLGSTSESRTHMMFIRLGDT